MGQTHKNMIGLGGILVLLALPFVISSTASANQFTSPNFKIDTSVVGGSIAGGQTSTSYRLTSSGGESLVGNGASGSYKMGEGYIPTLESSLQLTVQPNGLQIFYPFDENNGTAVWDASANLNNASTSGAPTWTTGKVGSALTFNGSTQSVVGTDVDLASNITVEAWVRPGAANVTGKVVSKHSGVSDINGLISVTSGVPAFEVTVGGTQRTVTSGVTMTSGVWYHLVGTYDGSNVRMYVNGSASGTPVAATGAIATNNFGWTIGRDASSAFAFLNATIDEVKILNRALSAEEIQAEYDAQNAGLPAGLSFVGGITPGVSKTSSFDSVMLTDAPGYTLAINQNNNLTSGGNTIAAVSGSIASPVSWVEGTTKGLGFTLYGTNATAIAGTWSAGASYAALPNSGTTFYTRTGLSGGVKDYVNMRLRLDTPTSQVSGLYTNQMTITGTMTP